MRLGKAHAPIIFALVLFHLFFAGDLFALTATRINTVHTLQRFLSLPSSRQFVDKHPGLGQIRFLDSRDQNHLLVVKPFLDNLPSEVERINGDMDFDELVDKLEHSHNPEEQRTQRANLERILIGVYEEALFALEVSYHFAQERQILLANTNLYVSIYGPGLLEKYGVKELKKRFSFGNFSTYVEMFEQINSKLVLNNLPQSGLLITEAVMHQLVDYRASIAIQNAVRSISVIDAVPGVLTEQLKEAENRGVEVQVLIPVSGQQTQSMGTMSLIIDNDRYVGVFNGHRYNADGNEVILADGHTLQKGVTFAFKRQHYDSLVRFLDHIEDFKKDIFQLWKLRYRLKMAYRVIKVALGPISLLIAVLNEPGNLEDWFVALAALLPFVAMLIDYLYYVRILKVSAAVPFGWFPNLYDAKGQARYWIERASTWEVMSSSKDDFPWERFFKEEPQPSSGSLYSILNSMGDDFLSEKELGRLLVYLCSDKWSPNIGYVHLPFMLYQLLNPSTNILTAEVLELVKVEVLIRYFLYNSGDRRTFIPILEQLNAKLANRIKDGLPPLLRS